MYQAGHFVGRIQTEWIPQHPRDMVVLAAAYYYDKHGVKWSVHFGDRINGASIPWFFRRIFPCYIGWYRIASVFHDVACVSRDHPSWKVHRMYRECVIDCYHTIPLAKGRLGRIRRWLLTRIVGPLTAWVMWMAIWIMGPHFAGRKS